MLNGDGWTWQGDAEAGVTCSFSDQPCRWPYSPCGVSFGRPELSVRVTSGETVEVLAAVGNSRFGETCSARFLVDVPWLSVRLLPPHDDRRLADLLLTIDATGLSAGTRQGRVEAVTELARDCLEVTLQVEARVPVEEKSWGQIKALYRHTRR